MFKTVCNSFTKEQREVINEILSMADMPKSVRKLEIKNSGRLKTTAGQVQYNLLKGESILKMNKRLFNTTGTIEDFRNTFSHELAHVVANFKHHARCGHDYRWKREHKALGGTAKRCHTMEVEHLRPKTKKHSYKCDCSIYKLSTRRHNKVLRGQSVLSCRVCGAKLREV
jgi:predicted SprT family Zn-dependent metalloprotease